MREKELMDFQRELPKIDMHEHIVSEAGAVGLAIDIFDVMLMPYNCDTLRTAGCSEQEWNTLRDKSQEFEKRYAILEKYIPYIKYTAFFRAVSHTFEITYGEKQITQEACRRADAKLKEELKKPHYSCYMEKYHIEKIFCYSAYDALDSYKGAECQFVPTVSDILPRSLRDIKRLEAASGICVCDLPSCLEAVSGLFEKYAGAGVKAIKFGSAYHRKLNYGEIDFVAAQQQLQTVFELRLMGDTKNSDSLEPCCDYWQLIALDDYLTNYMMNLCRKYGFIVVFHTAMHAWNENDPERVHCHYLTGLIRKFEDVRFVLLHTGAPYFEEAILLARYYANVYLDLTWFHIISPALVREAIRRILELVPINKVFAFGGDYCYIQTLAGHLEMAMQNFAHAFGRAIDEGILEEADAKHILRLWYYDNPKRIFLI